MGVVTVNFSTLATRKRQVRSSTGLYPFAVLGCLPSDSSSKPISTNFLFYIDIIVLIYSSTKSTMCLLQCKVSTCMNKQKKLKKLLVCSYFPSNISGFLTSFENHGHNAFHMSWFRNGSPQFRGPTERLQTMCCSLSFPSRSPSPCSKLERRTEVNTGGKDQGLR